MVAHAAPSASGGPTGLDGPRAGGSRLVRSLAVAAYHAAGGAPVFADQYGWDLAASGPGAWGPLEDLGAAAGHDVAGDGDPLQKPSPPPPPYPSAPLGTPP